MEGLIGPALAEVLEANRDRYNARFAQVRRQFPRLDGAAFLNVLRRRVEPITRAGAGADADRLPDLIDVLYEVTLEMLGKGLIGPHARHADFEAQWGELMLAMTPCIYRWPRELIGPLTNALYNLHVTPRCWPRAWLRSMAKVAADCADPDQVRAAGQIAAWTCGMAQHRKAALALASKLPTSLTTRLLSSPAGSAASVSFVIQRLAADPWFDPRRPASQAAMQRETTSQGAVKVQVVAVIGGFRGLGGEFLRPPLVAVNDGALYASDGTSCWLVMADAFGAIFHRVAMELPKNRSDAAYSIKANGLVRGPTSSISLPLLGGASSSAATSTTLAVTLPMSHRVFLFSERQAS